MSDQDLEKALLRAKSQAEDENTLPFEGAFAVLTTFLPKDVVEKLTNGAEPFLGISDTHLAPEFQWRFPQLADYVFVLRNSDGFSVLLERLSVRSLRATFFEAQAAATFADKGHRVTIRKETGTKGNDFDFAVDLAGTTVNCEVTALEAPQFSAATIKNALGQKRSQLPADAPAVIFCTVPEVWVRDGLPLDEIDICVAEFLRATRRVNAVVVCWNAFTQLSEGGHIYANVHRPIFNLSPRHSVDLQLLTEEDPAAELVVDATRMGSVGSSTTPGGTLSYMRYLAGI